MRNRKARVCCQRQTLFLLKILWREDWENRCRTAGAVLACDCVICNGAPDENACADCVALGEALA